MLAASVYGQLAPSDWVGGNDWLHPRDSGYAKVAWAPCIGGAALVIAMCLALSPRGAMSDRTYTLFGRYHG